MSIGLWSYIAHGAGDECRVIENKWRRASE
jgi:hypothetical protein